MLEVVTRLFQELDAAHPVALSGPLEMLARYLRRDGLTQTELTAKAGLDQSLISKHLQSITGDQPRARSRLRTGVRRSA